MRGTEQRLSDIVTAIDDMESFVSGMTEKEFLEIETRDRRTYRAMLACLIALGEAVKALPPDIGQRHPNVDWRGFAGLRDVITHQYFRVELDTVWRTVTTELPELRAAARDELDRIHE
jgi:uncharacterized protein with HEPN domain